MKPNDNDARYARWEAALRAADTNLGRRLKRFDRWNRKMPNLTVCEMSLRQLAATLGKKKIRSKWVNEK